MFLGLGFMELLLFLLVVGLWLWATADILRNEPEWDIPKLLALVGVLIPLFGPLTYLLVRRWRRPARRVSPRR